MKGFIKDILCWDIKYLFLGTYKLHKLKILIKSQIY